MLQEFRCADGSGVIPVALVNDDYCDCIDGSDEPGTCTTVVCVRASCISRHSHSVAVLQLHATMGASTALTRAMWGSICLRLVSTMASVVGSPPRQLSAYCHSLTLLHLPQTAVMAVTNPSTAVCSATTLVRLSRKSTAASRLNASGDWRRERAPS